jgi:queuine/archaeosine tRNA-ribosyltransferase
MLSNNYFEVLESVEIDGQKIENIAVGEDRVIENLSRGAYRIVVITCSQLKLEAPVSLTGLNSPVRIIIEDTGKILLAD